MVGESLVIIDAAVDTVIGTTALPFEPYLLAYSPTANRVYLGADWSDTLLVVDPDGDSILHAVDVGASVMSLLWDSAWNRLYVGTDADSEQLKVFDCTADTLFAEVQVDGDFVWKLTLSTVSRKLYCVGESGYPITVVSTDSLQPVGSVPGLSEASNVVYNPVADRLYWFDRPEYNPDAETVFVVDCRVDTIRARLVEGPIATLAVSTLSGRAYLGPYLSGQALVVDTTDSVVDSISLPTAATDVAMALTYWPDRNELYGATYNDVAFVIDASADTVAGVVSYTAYLPRQMVHNPAGNKLYLLCPGQDDVLVMDSTFGTPKHIFGGVTNNSAFTVLNQALNRLYVADDDELKVIDCNSDLLLGSKALYGINEPIPVMVPYLNKLYVFFSTTGTGDSVYVYDCLRDTVFSVFYLADDVPCAVYDPRSNRIFFACHDAPTVRALDPETDSVVKTFDLVGGSYRGKMALNLDLGRLYYIDQSPDILFTIDVLTDSIISSESMPGNVDTMFLNRRLGKLYLCLRSQTLVFDCRQNTIVDTIDVGFRYAGLMNDRNDRLYLRYGAVVDCRYDSVVTMLPPGSLDPRSMAWDAIDNRVFQATTSRLYVYRDDPYGVEDKPVGTYARRLPTIIRGVLVLGAVGSRQNAGYRAELLDVSGRKVLGLKPGANDVRALAPGVYFVRQASSVKRDASSVMKVVVTR